MHIALARAIRCMRGYSGKDPSVLIHSPVKFVNSLRKKTPFLVRVSVSIGVIILGFACSTETRGL